VTEHKNTTQLSYYQQLFYLKNHDVDTQIPIRNGGRVYNTRRAEDEQTLKTIVILYTIDDF